MRHEDLVRTLSRRAARDAILRLVRGAAVETGARVWLVGGAVRDAALGLAAEDVDLVADRVCLALVRRLEAAWSRRGFRFRKRGVTTWRFAVEGREVDLVDATRRGLLEDLTRRDFTINAVAFDILTGALADPLGGLRDLRAGRLRLPRQGVVREDPLRALRAARFLGQLPGFRLDAAARREAASVARALARTSIERVRAELDRLLAAPAPSRGLRGLEELGLLDAVLPELAPLRDCTAGGGRPHVWRHTLDAIAQSERPARLPGAPAARDPEARLVLRWALLLHDVAKPKTLAFREGRPTFHGHETLGARRADRILRRLKEPRERRRRVVRLVAMHLRPSLLAGSGAPARGMRRLVREAGEDLPLLLVHAACDALASGDPEARPRWKRLRLVLEALWREYGRAQEGTEPRLVTGEDVMRVAGIPEGPEVGVILEEIRSLQAERRLRTRQEALHHLASLPRLGPPRGAP